MWQRLGSNQRPSAYEAPALTSELRCLDTDHREIIYYSALRVSILFDENEHKSSLKQIDEHITKINEELGTLLKNLCEVMEPFPGFMGMSTLQAVELEMPKQYLDFGCVVVCPDGALYELTLKAIPGAFEVEGFDQVEELRELSLKPVEFLQLASIAVSSLLELTNDHNR